MAGLAAALNAPGCIDALSDALAPRGADAARSRLDGARGAVLEVAVRAAMPEIARVVADPDSDQPRVVAAVAVDGVASATELDGAYSERGAQGLVDAVASHPYAVVLADA